MSLCWETFFVFKKMNTRETIEWIFLSLVKLFAIALISLVFAWPFLGDLSTGTRNQQQLLLVLYGFIVGYGFAKMPFPKRNNPSNLTHL